jgi:endonuclease VIII
MPEGHTVHRTANHFKKHFVGEQVLVTSPQGRFSDSKLVTGTKLLAAQAIGKQLFLKFEPAILRIHLGIYGKWQFSQVTELPDPKGAVRARFISGSNLADLRGPTACELLTTEQYLQVLSRLGPDPLDSSADMGRFVDKVGRSSVSIGQLLMDQSVISGIGNVYRAELLFRANLNPHTPGKLVPREVVEAIWNDAAELMPLGVKTGLMLTRDGFLKAKTKKDDRYYVYKREGLSCRECGNLISIEVMATRKLYFCAACQP